MSDLLATVRIFKSNDNNPAVHHFRPFYLFCSFLFAVFVSMLAIIIVLDVCRVLWSPSTSLI